MKYGFIGCGNMGGALATALSKKTDQILLCSKSGTSAAGLAEKLGCEWTQCNEEIVNQCQVILLGVKPQMMAEVLAPLKSLFAQKRPLVVSMAAGLSLQQLEEMTAPQLPIIRIMPNTPVSIGKGMITFCHNGYVCTPQVDSFLKDFSEAGLFSRIAESQMDAASAVAGCSPAYAFMFIEAMADGAVACGLPRDKALQYAAQAVAGAAELLMQSGTHPGQLKDAVCSPGGSTIAGVRALEEQGFRGAVMDAICAAFKRNQELGK